MLPLLTHGLAAPDAAALVLRVAVGVFFAISGGNKLFVPTRHASLRRNLHKNGLPCVPALVWWVAGWEFVAGIMLALGLLTAFSAGVLLIVCMVAFCCEANGKVRAYAPINRCDVAADYLYLPETLYGVALIAVLLLGPGSFSVDYALWGKP